MGMRQWGRGDRNNFFYYCYQTKAIVFSFGGGAICQNFGRVENPVQYTYMNSFTSKEVSYPPIIPLLHQYFHFVPLW